jgi:hypothetical protein
VSENLAKSLRRCEGGRVCEHVPILMKIMVQLGEKASSTTWAEYLLMLTMHMGPDTGLNTLVVDSVWFVF